MGVGRCVATIGSRESSADVIDLDQTCGERMCEHDVTHFVLRPDYYVAATANGSAELHANFATVVLSVLGQTATTPAAWSPSR